MGWSVRVEEITLVRAVCVDCSPVWLGPMRLLDKDAEEDRLQHYNMHVQGSKEEETDVTTP